MKFALLVIFFTISFCIDNFSQNTIENAFLLAKYEETSISDTTDLQKRKIDVMGLEISKSASRYYSLSYVDYRKTIEEQILKTNTIDFKNLGIPKNKRGKDDIIYKNHVDNKIIALVRLGVTQYIFQEQIPAITWQILNDTMKILNYSCQKAICQFRGRKYEAWFTTEINVNEGPWKFSGLPGLILKVSDSKGHFLFECKSIEKIDVEIPSVDLKTQKISKETYVKLYRQMMEDPVPFMNDGKNSFTLETPPSSIPKRPYNPIELTEK